jgi:magnesium chelatase family protein
MARYRNRISGPLVDRIDIQIEVPAVPVESLAHAESGEPSRAIRERVERARTAMLTRQEKPNAKLTAAEIPKYCPVDDKGAAILQRAIAKLGLSARAYHRILKVARTIADLGGESEISASQIAEAIQYRTFDRRLR